MSTPRAAPASWAERDSERTHDSERCEPQRAVAISGGAVVREARQPETCAHAGVGVSEAVRVGLDHDSGNLR